MADYDGILECFGEVVRDIFPKGAVPYTGYRDRIGVVDTDWPLEERQDGTTRYSRPFRLEFTRSALRDYERAEGAAKRAQAKVLREIVVDALRRFDAEHDAAATERPFVVDVTSADLKRARVTADT